MGVAKWEEGVQLKYVEGCVAKGEGVWSMGVAHQDKLDHG